MRSTLLSSLACSLVLASCGEDAVVPPDLDAPNGNHPEPRVIAGGGIGDGPIDGVLNLYVIDEATREPIVGAEVQVGELLGSTDADGLIVVDGVVGPQDVVVKAAGKRKEMWLGVNGANVTVNLEADNQATPSSKTLSGSVTGFESIPFTVAQNHLKVAFVSYSQTDKLGDPANELVTPNGANDLPQNLCLAADNATPCNFSIVSRTGKVALFAMVVDLDTKGTPDGADDTTTFLGFAVRQGIDTATASTGQDLTLIADANTQNVTIDYGSPPATLTTHGALVGIELGDEGVLAIGSTATTSMKVPKLTALTGATGYRLTGIASDGATKPAQSFVLRRSLAGTSLSAGSWLPPPSGLSLTKSGGSWTNASGATVHGIELTSGSSRLLNISVFDERTSFELPALITLPSGPVDVTVNAFAATDFDVTNFSLDADLEKIDRVAGQATTIN